MCDWRIWEQSWYKASYAFAYAWFWAFLVAQPVSMPAMWETWVSSLIQEEFLEKGMATLSMDIIPWTEKPGVLQSIGLQRFGHD